MEVLLVKKSFLSGVLAAAFALGLSLTVHAAEFSADMITTTGGQTTQAKMLVKDKKTRMEMPQATMINRMDLGVSWMLMPGENMYMEHPIDQKAMMSVQTEGGGEISREPLGQEAVDGQPADKFRVTYNSGGQTQTLLQWIGPNSVPVKTAAEDGSWSTEFRNIQTSGVDDSQFEIPAGYTKFEMPAMPQGMGGMPSDYHQ